MTKEVTSAPGNARPGATPPDATPGLTCGNRTQRDAVRRNRSAWHAEGQGSESLSFASFSDVYSIDHHVLDNDLPIAKPVSLAATARKAAAPVGGDQMRDMFAFLRMMTVPASLSAAPEDWSDAALSEHAHRPSGARTRAADGKPSARKVWDEFWDGYQRESGGASETESAIDLDTDLWRLATGRSFG